jgi:hypothetical protein
VSDNENQDENRSLEEEDKVEEQETDSIIPDSIQVLESHDQTLNED